MKTKKNTIQSPKPAAAKKMKAGPKKARAVIRVALRPVERVSKAGAKKSALKARGARYDRAVQFAVADPVGTRLSPHRGRRRRCLTRHWRSWRR